MKAEKRNFKIVWDIELEATDPLAAAKEAQSWLQSRGDNWSFYVQEEGQDKPIFSVDLAEEDDDAVLEIRKDEYHPMIEG